MDPKVLMMLVCNTVMCAGYVALGIRINHSSRRDVGRVMLLFLVSTFFMVLTIFDARKDWLAFPWFAWWKPCMAHFIGLAAFPVLLNIFLKRK